MMPFVNAKARGLDFVTQIMHSVADHMLISGVKRGQKVHNGPCRQRVATGRLDNKAKCTADNLPESCGKVASIVYTGELIWGLGAGAQVMAEGGKQR